ncbi:DUF4381 domain-containing protein [Microbulbifer sp. ALW1]|uniref:DUF4381 domain-containing protein n=1 Tax=Microbulbifer sp. (strain ALW1) TaxID=1516059 RepID=UPI00135B0235|nr:DUF4381 domain-containing protein [Microbulbifer sp. ALW1]
MKLMAQQQTAQPAPQMTPEMQALLEQLKDIHEPAAIGWWPLAPGWWILAGTLVALIFAAAFIFLRLRQKRRKNLYRSEGVRLLQAVDLANPRAVEEINILMKRVAVVTFGREPCAALTGERWIAFLQSSVDQPIPQAAKRALLENLYSDQLPSSSDVEALRDYAIYWAHKHERPIPADTLAGAKAVIAPNSPEASRV